MNLPAEQIGSVPQAGVNPSSVNPQPQSSGVTPEELSTLRQDPELIEVFKRLSGEQNVPMDKIPDEVIVNMAGALHKLGVDGLVQKLSAKMNPQVFQEMSRQQGGN